MRPLLSFILLAGLLASCKQGSSDSPKVLSDTSFSIIGYFDTVPNGTRVILTYLGIDTIPDTAVMKEGVFRFQGRMQEPLMAQVYSLGADNNPSESPLMLVAENAVINIEGKKGPIKNGTVIGGLQNSDFNSMKKVLTLYWDSIISLSAQSKQVAATGDTVKLKQVQAELSKMSVETKNALKQFIIEHPTSIAGAYYVYTTLSESLNINELDTIYNSFDSSIRNSIYVKKIKEKLAAAQRTAIGQQAPELYLNNPQFDTVTLASYKGKFLLIQFWSSHREPARKDNRALLKVYNKFKAKGFDVLGVSLDEDKSGWQQAIKQDRLPWQQVSDLKGWKSSAVALYGIQAVPANVLLDRDGKIIDKDLPAPRLQEILQQHLR